MDSFLLLLLLLLVMTLPVDHQQFQLFSDNPDIYRSSMEMIEARGFNSERHLVTTEDGYILQIFRIRIPDNVRLPPETESRHRRPVLLWHGVAVDSDSWLYSTPDGYLNYTDGRYREIGGTKINDCKNVVTNTLAYTLAACGYDVWLGNSRGGKYADRHVNLTRAETQFWRFTLTEMAIFDVPAVTEYILRFTHQRSLAYIGHSLGTDQMFALQSMIPETERIIRPFVALAPVAYLGRIWSIARLGVPLESLLRKFPGPLGVPAPIMQAIGSLICGNDKLVSLCTGTLFSINGYDPLNFNRTIVPADVAHDAITVSTWVYAHLAQMVRTGRYQMFDYGTQEANVHRYNRPDPPDYPLENIRSNSIALFRGRNDPLADVIDVDWLVRRLNVTLLDDYTVPYDWWNHQDFQLGSTQGLFVNQRLLEILDRESSKIQ